MIPHKVDLSKIRGGYGNMEHKEMMDKALKVVQDDLKIDLRKHELTIFKAAYTKGFLDGSDAALDVFKTINKNK